MWSLKSVDTKMNIDAQIPGERLMMHVTAVLVNGEKECVIPFTIENKELMDQTLLSIINRINTAEQEVAITPNGEAYEIKIEEKIEEVKEPTPEEIYENTRAKIRLSLASMKEDLNLGLITNPEYQKALNEAKNWLTANKPK